MPTASSSPSRYALVLLVLAVVLCACLVFSQAIADNSEERARAAVMDLQRLEKLLKQHFPNAPFHKPGTGVWLIQVDGDPDKQTDAEDGSHQSKEGEGGDILGQNDGTKDLQIDKADPMDGMMMVMTDEKANRMRMMMPIQPFDPAKEEDVRTALIALHANYDRALDARYAVSDGILWSAFIHPLSSLSEEDLASAIHQVRTLRKNTGTTYSSGALLFAPKAGGQPAEGDEAPPIDPTV